MDATLETVQHSLLLGAGLVIVVLVLFLGNLRAALITAMVIPLSMMVAVIGMHLWGVSGNLLSLGALDFGIIVDGAVIVVEQCVRRLSIRQQAAGQRLTSAQRAEEVTAASVDVLRPAVFGQVIIMIVYVPILTLTGVEGRMFTPMAFTVVAAMVGALLLSVTFVPAAVAAALGGHMSERENPILRFTARVYDRVLDFCLHHRLVVVATSVLLFAGSLLVGSEAGKRVPAFARRRRLTGHALRIPGTSLSTAVEMQTQLERKLQTYPEVS